jgi:hypothetical protein
MGRASVLQLRARRWECVADEEWWCGRAGAASRARPAVELWRPALAAGLLQAFDGQVPPDKPGPPRLTQPVSQAPSRRGAHAACAVASHLRSGHDASSETGARMTLHRCAPRACQQPRADTCLCCPSEGLLRPSVWRLPPAPLPTAWRRLLHCRAWPRLRPPWLCLSAMHAYHRPRALERHRATPPCSEHPTLLSLECITCDHGHLCTRAHLHRSMGLRR